MNDSGSLFVFVMIAGYFLPTLIGFFRSVQNRWSVAVVNVFLGWTIVGWVIALAMAVRSKSVERG